MAQATSTLPIRVTSSTPGVRGAYAHLMERLGRLPPRPFDPRFVLDGEELQERAELLRCHILAFSQYVSAMVGDTTNHSWAVHIDRKWIDASFRDLIGDICGQIEVAAETVRQEGTYRAA